MTNFEKQIRKLLVAVKNRAGDNFGVFRVDCYEGREKFNGVKEAVEFVGSVDDVRGITVFDKDGDVLGVFGIESTNYDYDVFDIVYDYTDNDFCRDVMNVLK